MLAFNTPQMRSLYSVIPSVSFAGKKLVGRVVFGLLVLASATIGALAGLFIVYSTDLPQIGELERFRPNAITELYDDQGQVIGSFALQRRVIASYDDFPKVLRDAVISIEDKDFEKHWGIDLQRVLGAAYRDITTHSRAQGASTLTMQLSRNLFLSAERNFSRKFQEIVLAIQIERRFTKPQIFTLYANQIYLGHGVYGFAAGSQYYFGKPVKDLTLEEAAVLASLPKSPTQYSPITNPQNTLRRRALVINAMLEDGKITAEQANRAKDLPLRLNVQSATHSIAPYFVEEIRRYLEKKYGSEEVHQNGLRVYTTLNMDWQRAANKAALDGLAAYERRHGWKGKLKNVLESEPLASYEHRDWSDFLEVGGYVHALVTDVSATSATVKFGHNSALLSPQEIAWTGKRSPKDILHVGDIVYVKIVFLPAGQADAGGARVTLEQDSGTQVAMMAVDNASGDIKAMIGGRDFRESQFNRATQALRQVGSSFKPFVYTAAIDTDTISVDDYILDTPTTFMTASGPYSPSNYDSKFWGNLPLRVAFANSRNIPALKVAEKVTIKTVIEYAHKFGITSNIPPYLPVALGSAEVTLFEQTAAFTTFPNDGVRVMPRYIRKVTDYDGHVREENFTEVKDVVNSKTARTMVSLLQGVVQQGTATAALKLKHPLGGKTGTTNDFTDAWFVGFSPSITCGVWIGFDEKKTLGSKETGGQAALPIWIDFMRVALQGRDNETFVKPAEETDPDKIKTILTSSPRTDDAEGSGAPATQAKSKIVLRRN
ncbi:MAG: Penicillin-binding protein [Candidatus Angelobacter sp.]|nr:Penicillin-binding protein [Candidatus Angelobacter sp.]